MHHVGILAYGSLISRPGKLGTVTACCVPNVETPFKVEFARSSEGRGGAPTLVPVEEGGSSVTGVILVMQEGVTLEEAKNLLYRREIGDEDSDKAYQHRDHPGSKDVQILKLHDFHWVKTVLYTKIAATIPLADRTAYHLACLAIKSVRKTGPCRDGITYLKEAIDKGVETPLTRPYEQAVLSKTGSTSLEDAYKKVQSDKPGEQ